MGVNGVGNPVDIAVSGLRAQSLRLNVISANIANINSRTESGQPYRRSEVVLATDGEGIGEVNIVQVAVDMATEFKSVYQPGHPDADDSGYVLMSNVDLPTEMTQLLMASRAYQANAAVLKRYTEMMDITTELLR